MFQSILAGLVIIAALAWKFLKKRNGETDYTITEFKEKEVTVVTEYPAGKDRVVITHYKMSDGSWKCKDRFYRQQMKFTGRPFAEMNNAQGEVQVVVLSNDPNLTWEDVRQNILAGPANAHKDEDRFLIVKFGPPSPDSGV